MSAAEGAPGTLSLIATPIGNLEDITLRALKKLQTADVILAEDTRRTRILLDHYNIQRPLESYHKDNEHQRTPALLRQLTAGQNLALVTDAGTPGISDPGYWLLAEALRLSLPVEVVPGASALLTALVGSGLPMEMFAFFGYPPAKASAQQRWFSDLKDRQETLVFFVSPHRLVETLEQMLAVFGDRRAALCREMTKKYEEFQRAPLSELGALAKRKTQGEYTLVLAGAQEARRTEEVGIAEQLRRLEAEGLSLNQAAAQIARKLGLPRSEVYALAHILAKKRN
ncbi:MAG: 16S rRNA (cytidine(1402)-2'-O)-methyltransferase [candidate division FCPU426 bacterium]